MQKAVVILIMLLLGMGITQPTGILQPLNILEKYEQCSHEDHDITPLDFIFEHLLNLESIVNLIEGEHEYEIGDEPHEPFQSVQNTISVVLGLPCSMPEVRHRFFHAASLKHTTLYSNFHKSLFSPDILRPPIHSA